MTFKVELSKAAKKDLKKLDIRTSTLIINWLRKNLEGCSNPRLHGKPLVCNHTGKWRYRVGDYRIIADILDDKIIILVLSVGHRREVY